MQTDSLLRAFGLPIVACVRGLPGLLVVAMFMSTVALAQDTESAVEAGAESSAEVAPVAKLEQYILSLNSFEATFKQTLYDGESEQPLQSSSGTIKLKRPGRFVWTYDSPEPQLIVGDGQRIWLYDEGLEQVTVNKIDERINGTPLQLLMEASPLTDGFDIESLGQADSIDWFALIPTTQSSDFEQVFIGLKGDAIAAMELRDSFGQATQIQLSDFRKDVPLADELFEFDVPEGVDVIGLDE